MIPDGDEAINECSLYIMSLSRLPRARATFDVKTQSVWPLLAGTSRVTSGNGLEVLANKLRLWSRSDIKVWV